MWIESEVSFMNPKLFEEEYYNRVIDFFTQNGHQNYRNFETFAYRELIAILQEEKEPNLPLEEVKMLQRIRTNIILLILAFKRYEDRDVEYLEKNNHTSNENKEYVKSLMQTVV